QGVVESPALHYFARSGPTKEAHRRAIYRGSPVPVTGTDSAPAARGAARPRCCHPNERASVMIGRTPLHARVAPGGLALRWARVHPWGVLEHVLGHEADDPGQHVVRDYVEAEGGGCEIGEDLGGGAPGLVDPLPRVRRRFRRRLGWE